MVDSEPIATLRFTSTVIEWRGPAPFLFAPVPDRLVGELRHAARVASYGWGVVPVEARIGATAFRTSLFPRGDTYLLPVKVAVQRSEQIALGQVIEATIQVKARR